MFAAYRFVRSWIFGHPNSVKLGGITSDYGRRHYRGVTTKIHVKVFDQYGNPAGGETLRDSIRISSVLPSDSVSHTPTRVSWIGTGVYTVEVSCLKVGETNLELEFDFRKHGTQKLSVKFVIFPPPISPRYSQIVFGEEQKNNAYEAGTEVCFNISLRDIHDNVVQKEENVFWNLDDSDVDGSKICVLLTDKTNNHISEESFLLNTTRTSLSKNNIYGETMSNEDERSQMKSIFAKSMERDGLFLISFTLFVAGEKELDVQVMNQSVADKPIPITVYASSPERIARVQNSEYLESETLTDNEVDKDDIAQENVWQILHLTLEDKFGNTVPLQATLLETALLNDQGSDVTSSMETGCFKAAEDGAIRVKYRVKMQGEFQLELLIRSWTPDLAEAIQEGQERKATTLDLLHLRVVAPFSPQDSKFYILHEFNKDVDNVPAIFVEKVINCKLELCDEKGNQYLGPFRLQKLNVYLNSEKKELRNQKESNGGYVFDLIYGKSEKKELEVTLNDERVALQCPDKFHVFGTEPYDVLNCNVTDYKGHGFTKIVVQGIRKEDVIGCDYSRLNNINRLLDAREEKGRLKSKAIEETTNGVEITTEGIITRDGVQLIHCLVLSHLHGQHYRNKANEFDKKRRKWKEKSQKAYKETSKEKARIYSEIKTRFGDLMSRSNLLARDWIFEMYNKQRPLEEIDLHGLLVADEEELRKYGKQLKQKRNEGRLSAEELVEKARMEQDEAIQKLRERLDQIEIASNKPPWLEVIVGAGHHSKGERKIEPKVRTFLHEQSEKGRLPIAEDVNEGSILITYKEYTGPEPCFGYYYCKTCKKSWCSSFSWVGIYQCCYRCHLNGRRSECYPMKQSKRRRDGYRKKNADSQFYIPPHRELQDLCQKCRELGHYCMPKTF